MTRIEKDMDSDEVKTTIDEDMKIADALGVSGTPSYVVGDEVVVGAVGLDELRDKIKAERKKPSAAGRFDRTLSAVACGTAAGHPFRLPLCGGLPYKRTGAGIRPRR